MINFIFLVKSDSGVKNVVIFYKVELLKLKFILSFLFNFFKDVFEKICVVFWFVEF